MNRIVTKRMVLRAFAPEDADALRSLSGQVFPAEEMGERPLEYGHDAAAWIRWANAAYGGGRGYWAAEEEGRLVGWFYLLPTPDADGLGTEGTRALVALAGGRVVMRTPVANHDACRSMEKIGFRLARLYGFVAPKCPLMVEVEFTP